MSAVQDRLKMLCEAEGISVNRFERTIGVSQGYVAHVNDRIGSQTLSRIVSMYNVSSEWLLNGTGDMRRPNGTVINIDNSKAESESGDAINANSVKIASPDVSTYIEVIRSQQETIAKLQGTIDRLLDKLN